MPHRFYISQKGYHELQKELNFLTNEKMPEILDAVSRARAHGDLRENGEYQAAKQLQRITNDRVNYLTQLFHNAKIINAERSVDGCARFGSWVSVQDENSITKKFKIVGEYEANTENCLLSIGSPLVKACIGRKQGDVFSVSTPRGEIEYEIVSIWFDNEA